MPFFIRKQGGGKTKTRKEKRKLSRKGSTAEAPVGKKSRAAAKPAPVAADDDEEIDSDEAELEPVEPGQQQQQQEPEPTEAELETAQEKRLRLAKLYLEEIKRQEESRAEAAETEASARSVADRLRDSVLERAGRLQRPLADALVAPPAERVRSLRCRQLRGPPTCAVLSPDDAHIYTGSKDCALIKWCTRTCRHLLVVPGARKKADGAERQEGHTAHILALAISSDNKYLVSGDRAHEIHVREPASLSRLHVFRGHRAAVTGLAFQRGTHQLFSAAMDRVVKVWSVHDRSYIETLFGHQSGIEAIDALSRERAVTCGGRDCTVRVWKLLEESQLVFTGHRDSIDCVRLINDEHFATGGQDGQLALWGVTKKKPLCSVPRAHGVDPVSGQPRWISALAALLNSDVIGSGASDGFVRLWRCGAGCSSLAPLMALPAAGFVGALAFSSDGRRLLVALGQEHRLGRWWRLKDARNQLLLVPLSDSEDEAEPTQKQQRRPTVAPDATERDTRGG